MLNDKIKSIFNNYAEIPDMVGVPYKGLDTISVHGDKLIHIAAANGDLDAITTILGQGEDVNITGEDGYTALHYAIEAGHVDVAKALIANGADESICNSDGCKPIDLSQNGENYRAR